MLWLVGFEILSPYCAPMSQARRPRPSKHANTENRKHTHTIRPSSEHPEGASSKQNPKPKNSKYMHSLVAKLAKTPFRNVLHMSESLWAAIVLRAHSNPETVRAHASPTDDQLVVEGVGRGQAPRIRVLPLKRQRSELARSSSVIGRNGPP